MEIVASKIGDLEAALPSGFKLVPPALSALLAIGHGELVDATVDANETFARLGCIRLIADSPQSQNLKFVSKIDGDRVELLDILPNQRRLLCMYTAFEGVIAGRHTNGKAFENAARELRTLEMNLFFLWYLIRTWQNLAPEVSFPQYFRKERIRGFVSGRIVPTEVEAATLLGAVTSIVVQVALVNLTAHSDKAGVVEQAQQCLQLFEENPTYPHEPMSVFDVRSIMYSHILQRMLSNFGFWSSPSSHEALSFFSIKDSVG